MAGTLAVKVALSQRLPLKKDQFYNDCIKGNHFRDSELTALIYVRLKQVGLYSIVNNQSVYLMK